MPFNECFKTIDTCQYLPLDVTSCLGIKDWTPAWTPERSNKQRRKITKIGQRYIVRFLILDIDLELGLAFITNFLSACFKTNWENQWFFVFRFRNEIQMAETYTDRVHILTTLDWSVLTWRESSDRVSGWCCDEICDSWNCVTQTEIAKECLLRSHNWAGHRFRCNTWKQVQKKRYQK